MRDAYQAKIEKCKAPKNYSTVHNILHYLLTGIRKGYDTELLCKKLNTHSIKPLVADKWTANSLQMQIMFIARLDDKNSLARGFMTMLRQGEATMEDLQLFHDRVRH